MKWITGILALILVLAIRTAGAAEARAQRLSQAVVTTTPAAPPYVSNDTLAIAGVVGFVVIVGLLLWRRKQSSVC